MGSTYHIKVQEFEGPFDLILYFIRRDELDINDIPIAKITDDFLKYIRAMEELDIDLASEFILVAATLVKIKSKMLLPRKPLDEEGEEIDPREEFIRRLVEYKRFKEVVSDFEELEDIQLQRFKGGSAISELNKLSQKALVETELESVSLYKLLEVFSGMMRDYEQRGKKVVHRVYRYPYSPEGQQKMIRNKLAVHSKISFEDLFTDFENRIQAIFTFLALLEMINERLVVVLGGEKPNQFWLKSN